MSTVRFSPCCGNLIQYKRNDNSFLGYQLAMIHTTIIIPIFEACSSEIQEALLNYILNLAKRKVLKFARTKPGAVVVHHNLVQKDTKTFNNRPQIIDKSISVTYLQKIFATHLAVHLSKVATATSRAQQFRCKNRIYSY